MSMTDAPLGGDAFLRQGRLDEAERAYLQAIAANPQNHAAHYGLGLALKGKGRHAAALEAFARATRLPSCPAQAFIEAGVAAAMLGRPQDSEGWIRRAAEVHPDRFEPHYFLGCLMANSGRHADAIASLRRALAVQSP